MRILIAEDDGTSRLMLRGLLENAGYEVQEAVNGAEAWNMLQQADAPRLVLLDWIMPEMDGFEVMCRVRERDYERPPYIVMVTARGEKDDIISGLKAGADDYIAKPYDAGELQARVEVGRRMLGLQERLSDKIEELAQAMSQIKTLRGIVPICSNCKKIRDDKGYWNRVEVYMREHTEAELNHHICPDCRSILSLDLAESEDSEEAP